MTAKEYLRQAYRFDQRINSKLQQIESLRSLTQRVTVAYGSEVVSHSRNNTALEDAVIRAMEVSDELGREINQLLDMKAEIAGTISQVRNENYRVILERRYLCFESLGQIAAEMKISRRWAIAQHDRAVAVVDKILSRREAC